MAKSSTDEASNTSRSDPDTRKASLLISGLVVTPDAGLDVFRDRRAADRTLDVAHLKRARDLLDAVSQAISSSDPKNWQRIERAWEALRAEAPAAETPAAALDATAGPAKPAVLGALPSAPEPDRHSEA